MTKDYQAPATAKDRDKSTDTPPPGKTKKTPDTLEERTVGDITYFDGSITKVLADGREVLSDHLAPGEKLRRETTDRYTAVEGTYDTKSEPTD